LKSGAAHRINGFSQKREGKDGNPVAPGQTLAGQGDAA
jgi:hypothetical protein